MTSIMEIILSMARVDQVKNRRLLLLYDWVTNALQHSGGGIPAHSEPLCWNTIC